LGRRFESADNLIRRNLGARAGMSSEPSPEEKILYQCVWCGRVFEKRMLSKINETRCPYCGFNVIKKAKPLTAKLIVTSKLTEEQRLLTET